MYIFNVCPCPAPRMTGRDKWLDPPRPEVGRYMAFKQEIGYKANIQQFRIGKVIDIIFLLPMPDTWSAKKKMEMKGKSHEQKPDSDNLMKAFCDALTGDDSKIWHMFPRKYWWDKGMIIITKNVEESGSLPIDVHSYLLNI